MKKAISVLVSLFLLKSVFAQFTYPSISSCESINYVQFNSLINYNSGCSPNSVIVYPNSLFTTTVSLGESYPLQVGSQYNSGATYKFGVWIDYNNDSVFTSNEKVLSSNSSFISSYITIPNDSNYIGLRRMRILKAYQPTDPYGNYNYGECEDYTIEITDSIIKPEYCLPIYYGGAPGFGINNVRLNTLHKCGASYATSTYTLVPESETTTDLQLGRTYYFLVSKGTFAGISGGYLAYIDYNDDHIFTGNEYVLASADDVTIKKITIPNDTSYLGKRRLRIRSRNHYLPASMCQAYSDGETKDFIVNIVPYVPDSNSKPANSWEHAYPIYGNQEGKDVFETYDKGYIINGTQGYYLSQTYTVKTSTDGKYLWKKPDKTPKYSYFPLDMDTTYDGGYVQCGITIESDSGGASFIRKFDACGNVTWTNWLGSKGNYDYAYSVRQLADSGYIVGGRYWGENSSNTQGRYGLARFNKYGDTLWVRDITRYMAGDLYQVIPTDDNCVLAVGVTYAPGPADSTVYYLRTFLTKLDSNGNELWTQLPGINQNQISGSFTIDKANGQGYMCAGIAWQNLNTSSAIAVIKTDLQGQMQWIKYLSTDSFYHFAPKEIRMINSNRYAILANRWDECDYYYKKMALFVIDSTGNLIHDTIIGTFYGNAGGMSITREQKIILTGMKYSGKNNWDLYVARYNMDLSIDTFTNAHYTYDTLCDSTTISIAEEQSKEKPELGKLQIYPNPCKDIVTIKLPATSSNNEFDIFMYNLNGKLVFKKLQYKNKNYQLDIGNYPSGIYMIKIIDKNQRIYSAKLVSIPD